MKVLKFLLHCRDGVPHRLFGTSRPNTKQRPHKIIARARFKFTETEVLGNHVIAPISGPPKGIVHLIGGAFAGAAPQFAYQFLIRWLAGAGYTVVSTPYAVTFRHLDCANFVHQEFRKTLDVLRQGSQSWMVEEHLPLHGVGHSNGALLHLLIGSQGWQSNSSNVVISYNNKEVKEAIPVPLDALQNIIRSAKSSPFAAVLPTTEALIEGVIAASALTRGVLDRRTAFALKPALDQIGSVLDEVADGYTDFTPSPVQSRSMISGNYAVPDTLILQFQNDAIDESSLALQSIQQSSSKATLLTLPGSHVTPCGGEAAWKVGPIFTPIDAVALSARSFLQADIRRMSDHVLQWLNAHT